MVTSWSIDTLCLRRMSKNNREYTWALCSLGQLTFITGARDDDWTRDDVTGTQFW